MNKYHEKLLKDIQKYAREKNPTKLSGNYSRSNHISYFVSTNELRNIAKQWIKHHQNISSSDFIAFMDSLFHGASYEEKSIGGKILAYSQNLRKFVTPNDVDNWVAQLQGWAEIDSLCQSSFTASDVRDNWQKWKKQLVLFAQSTHMSKKRASLVLLTGIVSKNDDKRFSDLAFANIQMLQKEKDILITKAISWLLRDLIKNHRKEVEQFLERYVDTLPKIALRETKRKLLTGKK